MDLHAFIRSHVMINYYSDCGGPSVAQLSEHSPFTSEAAGSILRENFLNVTRCEKSPSTPCRKSWVFSGHSGFLPQGSWQGGLG